MRQQYTPIFRSVLSSRLWAAPAPTRCVWMWFELFADPEGFVPSDLAGVALGANVSLQEAQDALAFLEAPDPHADPEDATEGRLVRRIRGGWQVLAHETNRELAKVEAQRARNRAYMRRYRASKEQGANDTTSPVEESGAPKPKPKTNSSEGVSPLPPEAGKFCDHKFVGSKRCAKCGVHIDDLRRADGVFDAPSHVVAPAVITRIPDDWQPSAELRDEARIAGVTRFDEHWARLKTGPIGGTRGVFAANLADYVRSMFGKWRVWEEIDRAKQPAPSGKVPYHQPSGASPNSVKGAPAWVLPSHAEFAKDRGLKLGPLAKRYAESCGDRLRGTRWDIAAEGFTHFLLTHDAEAA